MGGQVTVTLGIGLYFLCLFKAPCHWSILGPKKYQKIARMYDRTGLSTKCTLIKTGFKNLRTGTEAKFIPFVDALFQTKQKPFCFTPYSNSLRHLSLPMKVSLRD